MLNEFSRTELLIGHDAIEKLSKSKIAIFGVGGVGSFAAEGLARSGIGNFVLIDSDIVCITNINRQIHATSRTIGLPKVEVMAERIKEINPNAKVKTFKTFYLPGLEEDLISDDCDYIIDAVDTVTAKIGLVLHAKKNNIQIISSMGTGNKLDPTKLEISDISKTSICPLAKVVRKELRSIGINSLKVLYSKEQPVVIEKNYSEECTSKKHIPGSISFVPSVAGLIISGEVIKDLIKERHDV
ncbi:MAG: tRNA threonylcarbamoyladenosine dehydratase [Clostridia bacterium]|jgi:tRNA A37 threonylcarbamoyladenosine dehydratase